MAGEAAHDNRLQAVKATIPRTKPNLRQLLQQYPGWWLWRSDCEMYHSSEMLKNSKRFELWKTAYISLSEDGSPTNITVQPSDDYFYAGNGEAPVNPWHGEKYYLRDGKWVPARYDK